MRSLKWTLALLAAAVLAGGCATTQQGFSSFDKSPLETIKKPAVVIGDAIPQQITDALSTRMQSDGWRLAERSDAHAIFQVSGGSAVGFLSKVPAEVEARSAYRMTFDYTNVQGGIQVVGTLEISTNPDVETPLYEELVDWDARAKVQKILDATKTIAPNFPVSRAGTPE